MAAHVCIPGCRGAGGNGCAPGLLCTSNDTTIGWCVSPALDAGAPGLDASAPGLDAAAAGPDAALAGLDASLPGADAALPGADAAAPPGLDGALASLDASAPGLDAGAIALDGGSEADSGEALDATGGADAGEVADSGSQADLDASGAPADATVAQTADASPAKVDAGGQADSQHGCGCGLTGSAGLFDVSGMIVLALGLLVCRRRRT